MKRLACRATGAATVLAAGLSGAHAHAIVGPRVFPVTLTLDDPGVADEASVPTISYQRSGAEDGPGPVHETDIEFEYDKRITRDFGLGLNDGFVIQHTEHDKTRTGFEDVVLTGKYQLYLNAPHELIVSVGVSREFGRTGTRHTGADEYGSTSPTVYVGKGFGDLPIGAFRAFAVTGELSYTIADKELKALPPPSGTNPAPGATAAQFNNGYANSWSGGLSFQYSLPYLVSQVHDIAAPEFFRHLIPLVEVAWTSPATSPSDSPATVTVAPGVIYLGRDYQVALEALIPANRAAGTNVGVVAQLHLFLDDILPHSLGKPIF
jgi:hypothetical protein